MPWVSWELGTKAAQAQELAEWLYWLQVINCFKHVGYSSECCALPLCCGNYEPRCTGRVTLLAASWSYMWEPWGDKWMRSLLGRNVQTACYG
jgi:hypothetical protein